MTTRSGGLESIQRATRRETQRLAADVQYYLTLSPRQLPSRYFYDALGSALFEAVCQLPWYGVTRAERRLLARHRKEIFARSGPTSTIVELASGSGDKLHALLEASTSAGRIVALRLPLVSAAIAMNGLNVEPGG